MKTPAARSKISGLTLLETLVVVSVIAILAALLLPISSGRQNRKRMQCFANLRQVDLGLILFAADHQGIFPMQIPVTNGGTMEFIYSGHTFPHFEKLKDYYLPPRTFICPYETNRQTAISYEALNDLNISYFLNADAATNNPLQSILAGDRFLQEKNLPVQPGLLVLTTNSNAGWMTNFHGRGGVLAFVDGHAEFIRDNQLKACIKNQPLPTNRLCIP
jgi:prepilin-type processing-associated H-X9-DG protein